MSRQLNIHIALADSGWILEKLASEIARDEPGITVGTGTRESAAIQYYMNYSVRRDRVSPVEMAFFTHSEQEPEARDRFFSIAHAVDQCICMSEPYAHELRNDGIRNVEIIVPGVDFEIFTPKLRLGVVGRTYKTGRKGEQIVQQLLDLDFVDWHFSGDGWPLPGEHPRYEDMGDFYRSMDYILVPSFYEGGPMCVLEALACGVPVIAPPVGWVKDYPHIGYPVGDAEALRGVLLELHQKKIALSQTVQHRSWENWRQEHLKLMRHLMPRSDPQGMSTQNGRNKHEGIKVAQVLHGTERASRGGPSTRVPKTAAELRDRGLVSDAIFFPDADMPAADIIHLYNIWPPQSALLAAQRARPRCRKLVFSPIFLNLAFRDLWDSELRPFWIDSPEPEHLAAAYRALADRLPVNDPLAMVDIAEPEEGYFTALCAIMAMADQIVCLSNFEASALKRIYGKDFSHSVIHNPVDTNRWAQGNAEAFEARHGIRDYALCVGRIEPRKNQLAVALALKDTDVPVVFLGGVGSQAYADALRTLLGENMVWIDHIDQDSDMLASAYKGASVMVSASWAEGASLSLLEAAASGLPLVIHDTGSEREYFGDGARYIDAADLDTIKKEVVEAYAQRASEKAPTIAATCSWEKHIDALVDLYAA